MMNKSAIVTMGPEMARCKLNMVLSRSTWSDHLKKAGLEVMNTDEGYITYINSVCSSNPQSIMSGVYAATLQHTDFGDTKIMNDIFSILEEIPEYKVASVIGSLEALVKAFRAKAPNPDISTWPQKPVEYM